MRYSYAAISMIIVGMMAFVILMVFQDVTVNNEADYYSIKEAMEASMVESIDRSYYARTGELKIVEEKFVANFTRRFVNNTMGASNNYVIDFYDIMESPPKASVVIRNNTDLMVIDENSADIVNNLTGILEATVDKSSYDGKICNAVIRTGTLTVDDNYCHLFKGQSTSYKMNVDYVKGLIVKETGLNVNNILNLRVSEIKDVQTINGKVRSILYSNNYKSYSSGGSWVNVPSTPVERDGSESNNCYASNVKVSIIDATGEKYDGFPVVGIYTFVTDVSSSGCTKHKNSNTIFEPASLVKYSVVWKYDYCG